MSWVNAVIQGILLGGLYALFACGLSLLFGVMRIINLAHGDLALVGAYMAYVLTAMSASRPTSRWCRRPGALVVGYVLQRTVLERACGRARSCRCSPRSACRSSSATCC